MQTLINSLINGTKEYKDNGEIISTPPTATALRASRELTNLANINATNHHLIMQLQARVNEQLQEILTLQSHNNELQSNIQKLQSSNVRPNNMGDTNSHGRDSSDVQHVREGEGQASVVASGSDGLSGSDSDSQGSGTN